MPSSRLFSTLHVIKLVFTLSLTILVNINYPILVILMNLVKMLINVYESVKFNIFPDTL